MEMGRTFSCFSTKFKVSSSGSNNPKIINYKRECVWVNLAYSKFVNLQFHNPWCNLHRAWYEESELNVTR